MTYHSIEEVSREAERRLPLAQLMGQYGEAPDSADGRKFKKCPFCGHKGSAGLFRHEDTDLFKCHHTSCSTGGVALNCVSYLKMRQAGGFWDWVRMAGMDEAAVREGLRHDDLDRRRAREQTAKPGPGVKHPLQNPAPKSAPEVEAPVEATAVAEVDPSEVLAVFGESADDMISDDAGKAGGSPAAPTLSSSSADDTERDAKASNPPSSPGLESLSAPTPPAQPPPNGTAKAEDDDPFGGRSELSDSALTALREFYGACAGLTAEDLAGLWRQRGLTPETALFAGLKRSCSENETALWALRKRFTSGALLRAGLWVIPKGKTIEHAEPNRKFFGWGATGRKRTLPNGDKGIERDWTNPILIPYFDDEGEVIAMRPHKDFVSDQKVQPYLVRPSRAWRDAHPDRWRQVDVARVRFALITEGEFKALAVAQAMWPEVECAALPGITNAKNWFVTEPIFDWLRAAQRRMADGFRSVVVYDNEEKGDPKLPGYKDDKWDRFDSIVWARYLATLIDKQMYSSTVGKLPDRWRDHKGKADWDGALALLLEPFVQSAPAGATVEDIWAKGRGAVRREFMNVLSSAMPEDKCLEMFGDEAVVSRKLAHIAYEPNIKQGRTGDANESPEAAIVQRIKQVAAEHRRRRAILASGGELKGPERFIFGDDKVTERVLGSLRGLADAYADAQGRLYVLKPIPKGDGGKGDHGENTPANWKYRQELAKSLGDTLTSWVCQLALQGTPEGLSDFTYKCHYVLRRSNGEQVRYVELFNIHGPGRRGERSRLVALPSTALATSVRFRDWAPNVKGGGYIWKGGDNHFQSMQEDMNHAMARMVVDEVAFHGCNENAGMWFFGDCAFDIKGGTVYREDKRQCFWKDGNGYRLARDAEGNWKDNDSPPQNLHHGAACMRPDKVVVDDGENFKLVDVPEGKTFMDLQDPKVVARLLGEFRRRLNEVLPKGDGDICLAMTLQSAAGPELYGKYSYISGLWLHGEKGHGKSSVARWLMYLWGYSVESGIILGEGSSITGLHIAAQQYCYEPIWLEEFRAGDGGVESFLRGMFDRGAGAKKVTPRKMRAVPIVTGETSAHDAACQSRYPHVLVADSNRAKHPDGTPINHYGWFQSHRHLFFTIGRHVMANRSKFAASVLRYMQEWQQDPTQAAFEARSRFTYGTAWSTIAALEELFHGKFEFNPDYAIHVQTRCRESNKENKQRIFIEQFLQDMISGAQRELFGMTPADVGRYFKATPVSDRGVMAPGYPDQMDWTHWRLFFLPGPVLDIIREQKRRAGQDMLLDLGDLRSQMSARPWFVPGNHVLKFAGRNGRAWGIDLNLLADYGYIPTPTGALEHARQSGRETHRMENGGMDAPVTTGIFSGSDPRYGPLFALVAALYPKARLDTEGKLQLK